MLEIQKAVSRRRVHSSWLAGDKCSGAFAVACGILVTVASAFIGRLPGLPCALFNSFGFGGFPMRENLPRLVGVRTAIMRKERGAWVYA